MTSCLPRGVPEAWRESASSTAAESPELYWPEGEPIGNLPERVALAFRAAEDPGAPETLGGLQLSNLPVLRYDEEPEKRDDYQALRPVWR